MSIFIFSTTILMEGGRALMDASSYVLIEASGDSESEYCHAAAEEEMGVAAAAAAAEDDAESCSCGSLSGCAVVHEADGGGGDVFLDGCVEDYGDEDDDGGGCGGATEVEDGVVDQCCGGGAAAKGCEDSNMNERDRDRLFWEACLAS